MTSDKIRTELKRHNQNNPRALSAHIILAAKKRLDFRGKQITVKFFADGIVGLRMPKAAFEMRSSEAAWVLRRIKSVDSAEELFIVLGGGTLNGIW